MPTSPSSVFCRSGPQTATWLQEARQAHAVGAGRHRRHRNTLPCAGKAAPARERVTETRGRGLAQSGKGPGRR